MEDRSWPWRRKSCEMSPGDTESSGSASSHSENYLDDKEVLRGSPNGDSTIDASQSHVLQSPEISSNIGEIDSSETVKSLSEKLSAALLTISVKEDLVKQHSKVAEEAVSGWEKAETEVAVLKQQLDATSQRNSALEDRISHLDGALKECVRQLRQSKEEHEQKVRDAVVKKTQEWESTKSELENQLIKLNTQLEVSKAEADKLETFEKENEALRVRLVTLSEELKTQRIESELSTQTAEAASKQHLESIKKVAKLEAECRKLRATVRKTSSTVGDYKTVSSTACVESLTDSQSDNCSDSWASALIAELDQFKNQKAGAQVVTSSVDIDMDDFLEMERLAAMPELEHGGSNLGLEAGRTSKVEDEVVKQKMVELEEKVEALENEKAKLELALADTQKQLTAAEGQLTEVRLELDLANELRQSATAELVSVEAKRKALESQFELTLLEVEKLQDKVASLEEEKVEESAFSSELKTRLEASEATRLTIESQAHLAYMEVEKLREKVIFFESRVEEERTLSAELAVKLENMEKLKEKMNLLEKKIEDERSFSTEFAAKVEAMEGEKKMLEIELELAQSKIQKLRDEMSLLEQQVGRERALSTEFAERCRNLEDELLRSRREAELRVVSCSNGELTAKQEKELAMAAEKLAECQKTIASLGRQLKSLTKLDDIMFEPEKL